MKDVFRLFKVRAGQKRSSLSQVVNYGYFLYSEGHHWIRRPFELDYGVVIITLRDGLRIKHGDRWLSAGRGSVSVYLTGEGREYLTDSAYEGYWFNLKPSSALRAILRAYGHTTGYTRNSVLTEDDIDRLSEIFAYARLDEATAAHRAAILAEYTVYRCLVDPPEDRERPRRTRLQDVAEYISQNPGRRHTRTALARMVHLSYSRFGSLFREEYGLGVGAYVTQARMDFAKRLLRTTDLTAAEIGVETGYRNPYSFYAAFKKATGQTPIAYRKTHRDLSRA